MEVLDTLKSYLDRFTSANDMRRARTFYNGNKEKFKSVQRNVRGGYFELYITIPTSPISSNTVEIDIRNSDEVTYWYCNCGKHNRYSPCIHSMEAYYYLTEHPDVLVNNFYKESFKRLNEIFSNNNNKNTRKQLKLEIYLIPYGGTDAKWEINLKIGDTKLYSIKTKMRAFFDSYTSSNHESYKIGKELIYSNNKYRFNTEDEKIIEFFQERYENRYLSSYEIPLLNGQAIKQFFSLLKEKSFTIQIGNYSCKVDTILDDFKLESQLEQKEDGTYSFRFVYDKLSVLTEDFEYILNSEKVYHLDFNQRKLLKDFLVNTDGNAITFKKDELPAFVSYFLPKIKQLSKNIEASEELQKEIQLESPINRIYFDYKRGNLLAEVKYFYKSQNQEIPRDSKISINRDYESEKRATQYLEDNDFFYHEKKKMYIMEDIDKQGLFLETKLPNIPEGFEFFASNAVKKLNVMQTPSISSGLSLGSDEWLRCDFEFSGLSVDDFKEVISSIKENKKYSKLKNGTIIKLDHTDEINDFYELLENFDIDYKKLDDLNFKIPKYKALYLDNYIEKENYITVNKSKEFQSFLDKFNEYKATKIKKCDKYDELLRDYQVTGVNFLMALSKCGFGGILADEMGLGKTFQAITYIKHRLREDSTLKFLVVVPTSLLYNWKSEFEKYAPNVSILIMNMLPNVRHEMFEKLENISVVITSYGLIRQDIEEYMNIEFDTCIIDEAQNIKNIQAGSTKALKLIRAKTKFALTGTPIENSLLELYSIFDFLMPGYFSTPAKFNDRFQKPIVRDNSQEAFATLNMAVAPFILRRKKSDVAKDLPDKIDKKIMIDLTNEQKKVYHAHLELAKKEIQEEMDANGFNKSQIKILSILTRLRQICIEPSLFIEGYNGGSSKIDAVLDFLSSAIDAGHKILLFSQFTSALHILESKFHEKGISYYYIDGGTKSKNRLEMVNAFNEDDTNVFLISLKAGGTGLNLTGADIVIHLDFWWNPAVENQATDRAHRIGQRKVVEVVKFVCQGTIEERVLELQERKKKISDGILEQENRDQVILSKLTEKDIKKLLDM